MSLNVNLPASGLVLIEQQVVPANTNVLTFSGLNGNIDVWYQLYFHFNSVAVSESEYDFRPNDTLLNGSTFLTGSGAGAVSSGSTGASAFAASVASNTATGCLNFFAKTGAGNRRFTSFCYRAGAGPVEQITTYGATWVDTTTNVTSIVIRSDIANAIGAGSVVGLYKAQQLAYSFVQNAPAQFNPTTIQTGAYAATVNDLVRVNPTGGGFTVTLPQPGALNRGMVIAVKNVTSSTNVITVASAGGGTIDGVASKTYNTAFFEMEFISDGSTNWAQR